MSAIWPRWAFRDALLGTIGAATVLIEAAATSGALRTARAARRAGRLAFAVPGTTTTWAGCRTLIDDGITLPVAGAAAVLNALRLTADRHEPGAAATAPGLDGPDTGGSLVWPSCKVPQHSGEDR